MWCKTTNSPADTQLLEQENIFMYDFNNIPTYVSFVTI